MCISPQSPAFVIAMQASERPFKDFWASTVYPAIKDDYERLQKTTPNRIATKLRQKAEKKDKEQTENQVKEAKEEKEKRPKTKEEEEED